MSRFWHYIKHILFFFLAGMSGVVLNIAVLGNNISWPYLLVLTLISVVIAVPLGISVARAWERVR
jgi:hypothetical protein